MRKVVKLLMILVIILGLVTVVTSSIYTDKIESDEHTIIISVCTGEMRALETGISVYAGYKKVPLILTDKTLPEQLDTWLPEYIKKHNITKIIVAGPVTKEQLLNFMKLKVTVKQVKGNTIAEILTTIAENDPEIRKDEIILTASDPLAGELGAYKKIPVFITAHNSTYQSSSTLDDRYKEYLTKNDIKKVTIVGNIPTSIKEEIKEMNISMEEISGETSLEISNKISDKLKKEGYLNKTKTAYYGFYGEIPTIIPTLIKENAILIEDSSNNGDIIPYLKENNITTVYITRNTETDYIQMEETDYINTDVINNLEENNITVKYLTKPRTLDEATGLYDMKMLTAEHMEDKEEKLTDQTTENIKTEPPLLAILNERKIKDSNNITATITQENNGEYIVKWNTIHPYYWTKKDENNYYATTKTGYEYIWTKENNTWNIEYRYNNTKYYQINWTKNSDNTWTESHEKGEYLWKYDGQKWKCYNKNNELIYYIISQ